MKKLLQASVMVFGFILSTVTSIVCMDPYTLDEFSFFSTDIYQVLEDDNKAIVRQALRVPLSLDLVTALAIINDHINHVETELGPLLPIENVEQIDDSIQIIFGLVQQIQSFDKEDSQIKLIIKTYLTGVTLSVFVALCEINYSADYLNEGVLTMASAALVASAARNQTGSFPSIDSRI